MISTAIKAKREAKGWSKKYLGDLIGVSSAAIGQYEKGDNKPKIEVLLKLSKVFDYDFINGRDNIELSQKSNINQYEIVNKSLSVDKQTLGVSDIAKLNPQLVYDENSTFPVSKPDGVGNEWRMLYFNQQQQINLLNKQVELLNKMLQK